MLERAIAEGHPFVCLSVCLSHCEPRLYGSRHQHTSHTVRQSDVSSLLGSNFVVLSFEVYSQKSVLNRSTIFESENLTNGARQDIRKLVLLTNRKSHPGFRLVLKSVTLKDLKRRNGRYFALLR